jgi:hypothetical protein
MYADMQSKIDSRESRVKIECVKNEGAGGGRGIRGGGW